MATDPTLRIKNLSIALEALSKVPENGKIAASVWLLLTRAIEDAEKETQWPQRQAPAKPETQYNPFTNNEDDIPF
jgi:hypothetical protein